MSSVEWGTKPSAKKAAQPSSSSALDAFVNPDQAKTLKRLNLNISAALHTRMKAQCALEGREMTEIIVEFLEQRFPGR